MRIHGRVASGALSGEPLVEHHMYQLVAELGFEPYKGTLDVRLDAPLDVERIATKFVEHVLRDGSARRDLFMAEVVLVIKRSGSETHHKCWAMQRRESPLGADVVELIDRHSLREKYSLSDGDEVELVFEE